MSATPEDPPAKTGEEVVVRLPLGDADGNDRRLGQAQDAIAERLNGAAPGTAGYRVLEWLKRCADPFVWVATRIPAALKFVADHFTDRQVALIKAESEAEKTRAEAARILAEAEVVRVKGLAEAKGIDANTEAKRAEAAALQVEVDRRLHELRKLKAKKKTPAEIAKVLAELGVDWIAEVGEDGITRVAFRKPEKLNGGGGSPEPGS